MKTLVITHEVDDVEHWLASPKRREAFGPLGISVRPFLDAERSHRVGLIVEVPSMAVFEELMASPEAAAAMAHDGVRPETMQVLAEA